mmetsp:Transcript_24278/g.81753  ORF Transcript_24278/g.81753 Transcript_24278/m.81753 type:complete len:87 (+) Transcript_24278:47-307(+)
MSIGSPAAVGKTPKAVDKATVMGSAASGRAVASAPKSTVMDLYKAVAGIVDSSISNNTLASVDPSNANAAAKTFYDFKVVVQASQQ